MTIDGLLKSHAAESSDSVLIGYPAKGVSDFEEHTAKDLDRFTDAAVAKYISHGLPPADPSLDEAPVVALLSPSGLNVLVTIFALNRLGYAILFLSTRLAPPAHASLLSMTKATKIILAESFKPTVQEVQGLHAIEQLPLVIRNDYRYIKPSQSIRRNCDPAKESKKIAWIIHSSGSTGFPKPIHLSNFACLANFAKGLKMKAFCTSPLFHSHCLMETGRAIYAKRAMYLGNYALPVTRQNLIDAMSVARPELLCAVPYVLKLLAESDDGIAQLTRLKQVLYGGSACPDDLGDFLVGRGVNLAGNYGATETGFIMNSFRSPGDKEWSYLRLHYPLANHVLMDEISPGVFECVALDGLPSKGPSNSDNPPNSFRTRDLFIRHPDPAKSNYWRYLSRFDDRITLVNGEKVLPLPIEGRIRRDACVKEAAVFGVGKSVPGVLIFRDEQAKEFSDEDFRKAIRPSLKAANAGAETFSRIPDELVIVLSADTVYPKTDKGTIIRAALYQEFAKIIEAAYDKFESSAEGGTLQLDVPELESFLLESFSKKIGVTLESVDSDIFSAGIDSLQTTRLYGIIKKDVDLGSGKDRLSQNIVFEKGTIRALAKHLHSLRTGEPEEDSDEIVTMQEMITKYSSFKEIDRAGLPDAQSNAVLVTGATGSLGAFLVSFLLKRSDDCQVYALVRASDNTSARQRVFDQLSARRISLTESQTARITVYCADLSQPNLGLSDQQLDGLLTKLTNVVHSAWAVNFNLGVRSFEAQHIAGTHNLIDLCLRVRLSRPAKFFFCSSISAASGTPKPATITESIIEHLQHAQKMGYGRSKLVAEHVTRNAMLKTGMHARVLRIGQLSADLAEGVWNDTEAVSLMIRSALTTGCLPRLDESPSWLPVDLCASSIVDLMFGEAQREHGTDPDLVYHVLNPAKFDWTKDLLPALKRSKLPAFETVSPKEWLQRLKTSNQDPAANPSVKLIDFWEHKYGQAQDPTQTQTEVGAGKLQPRKELNFETHRTLQDAQSLGSAGDLIASGYMEKVVERWMEKWSSSSP